MLGRDDDRHVVTVAGSRAGKSSTVLIPNLLRYPGSVLVLDPKGELARATAAQRRRMGQRVYVLDPFGKRACPQAERGPPITLSRNWAREGQSISRLTPRSSPMP